jgi:hypothetical protein
MVFPAHALRAVQVWLKAVRNEGHFTVEGETVFRLYLTWDCSGVSQKYHVVLPTRALRAVQVRLMAVSNEGHFTLRVETVFRPIFPSFAVGLLSSTICYPLRMRYKQWKFGLSRSVIKDTLL